MINFATVTSNFFSAQFMLSIHLIHLKSFTFYNSTRERAEKEILVSKNEWPWLFYHRLSVFHRCCGRHLISCGKLVKTSFGVVKICATINYQGRKFVNQALHNPIQFLVCNVIIKNLTFWTNPTLISNFSTCWK